MKYKLCEAKIVDREVEIPSNATAIKFGLIILGRDPGSGERSMRNGVTYLLPQDVVVEEGIDPQETEEGETE